jgi:hypothetical protein
MLQSESTNLNVQELNQDDGSPITPPSKQAMNYPTPPQRALSPLELATVTQMQQAIEVMSLYRQLSQSKLSGKLIIEIIDNGIGIS